MKKIPPFNTILFDLGGVIIDLSIAESRKAFTKAGVKNVDDWFLVTGQMEFLNNFERGLVDEDDFIAQVNRFSGTNISKPEFEQCWNAMLGNIPKARIELLMKLKSKYRVIALSNINSIHERGCNQILKQLHGINEMKDFFHEVYYSHVINERKPDYSCFEKVCLLEGINPAQTLFFDDNIANINTANSLGFQSFVVDKEICEIFSELGIG